MQAELDADTANDTSALDELQSQFNEAEQALAASSASMGDSINAMDNISNETRSIKVQLDAASREVEEAHAKLNKAKKRLEDRETERQFALRTKNQALEMVDLARQEKEDMEEQRTEQERVIRDEYLPGAEQVSRRVPVEPGNTVEVIDRKLESLTQEQRRFQERYDRPWKADTVCGTDIFTGLVAAVSRSMKPGAMHTKSSVPLKDH